MCSEGSPRSLLFRCCREIPSVNQKPTFDKRISCITRPDDFSPRSHPSVSLQVAPFLKDCKGRGYRLRWKTSEYIVIWFMLISKRDLIEKNFFSLSAALPYDPFRPREITDISIINEYFVWIDFHTALGFGTICFNKIVFLYLSCCSAVIAMTLLLLLLLVLQSRGELMAGGMDLRKPRLGEYTALSSSCLCQYPPEVSHCSPNRISVA